MANTLTLYGIPNCDTVKKARRWLDAEGIDYTFHDYKKSGVDATKLTAWIKTHGIDTIVNKRGTTWRKLPQETRDNMDETLALAVMEDQPAIIKRPVLEHNRGTLIGFSTDQYQQLLQN